jgi:hypothetical protein
MNRTHTTEDSVVELFQNLRTLCDERPPLPGDHGEIPREERAYEGHGEYHRLMDEGLRIELDWNAERLA